MEKVLNTYKPAIFFIVKFTGLFVLMNTLYGLFIERYHPTSDPLTESVSIQVGALLSVFHNGIDALPLDEKPYVTLLLDNRAIVQVYEGCNSVNVMIVYLSFIIAFSGRMVQTIIFIVLGCVAIYAINLLRVGLLFEIALNYPNYLYFFHKYLFTAFIYVVVFILWILWVKRTMDAKRMEHVPAK